MEYSGTVNSMIHCEHVFKEFATKQNRLTVIKDLNIDVKRNEFVVILGPGQCGKTTLVNLIAGLDTVSSGKIVVNGKVADRPDPDRGVVYQKTALFPWLTVMKNVDFGPRMKNMPKQERIEKAEYYINLVGLKGFEKSYPIKLSGGMRQRVGIARAYCNDPTVMLMDEPFGHLDAQTRYLMQEELERIWTTEKRTVLFVTNNIEEAIYLADRIIILSECPATVVQEVKVDLPRPRDYVSEDFLKLRKEITEMMQGTYTDKD